LAKKPTKERLTEAQVRALGLLKQYGSLTPSDFAHLMWPDSKGHANYSRHGKGKVVVGAGIRRSAGGYLSRLARRGFVDKRTFAGSIQYNITDKGLNALAAYEFARLPKMIVTTHGVKRQIRQSKDG